MRDAHRKTDILAWMLDVLAFVYIVLVYVVTAVPGASVLCFAATCALAVLLVLRGRLVVSKLVIFPLLFLVFSLLSCFWATHLNVAADGVRATLSCALGGICLWVALSNGVSWRTIVIAIVVGASISIATSVGEIGLAEARGRVSGILDNSNRLARNTAIGAIVILIAPIRLSKWMYLFPLLFIAYPVLYSGSRQVLIPVAMLFLLGFFRIRRYFRSPALYLLVGCGLAVSLAGFAFLDMGQRDLERIALFRRTRSLLDGTAPTPRPAMIEKAIRLWWERPIFGHGVEQFRALGGFDTYSANTYTELLANCGIVGIALYYSFHMALLRRVGKGALMGNPDHESALVMLLILLLTDFAMVAPTSKALWIFLGLTADLATRPINPRSYRSSSVVPRVEI